ncbi:hypothetical protein [Bacillus sp. Au-Bac7]|uniref:hypothetical protein n=1 Tax=Bacillus sp. Au-Bac7 TaxID=2906458 RepID=UPI001E6013C4|nr:hypothetical protein [Bacillus sp. Au-Bac7]MCE4052115.1 hypothetical protein [Bacillus sp. Au-Bac7]
MKKFFLITTTQRTIILIANDERTAGDTLKRYGSYGEEIRTIRKLSMFDLSLIREPILVLPNKEYI